MRSRFAPALPAARAEYPDHPVKVVVPYSPGGPADLFGRFVAGKLTAALGQTFVVENKPGAGLVIGAQYAAASAPDGYTLLPRRIVHAGPTSSRVRTPADNLKDFACISLVGSLPLVVIANPSLPVRNVRELIALARKSTRTTSTMAHRATAASRISRASYSGR